MVADRAAAVGAERSVGTTRGAVRMEHRRAEPVGTTNRRSPHHHLRAADGKACIQQEGVQPCLDLLLDAKGDIRLQRGCGVLRRNRRAATGHGHHGSATARVSRIQQQVESNSRSSFDLLLDANTEPCGRPCGGPTTTSAISATAAAAPADLSAVTAALGREQPHPPGRRPCPLRIPGQFDQQRTRDH